MAYLGGWHRIVGDTISCLLASLPWCRRSSAWVGLNPAPGLWVGPDWYKPWFTSWSNLTTEHKVSSKIDTGANFVTVNSELTGYRVYGLEITPLLLSVKKKACISPSVCSWQLSWVHVGSQPYCTWCYGKHRGEKEKYLVLSVILSSSFAGHQSYLWTFQVHKICYLLS